MDADDSDLMEQTRCAVLRDECLLSLVRGDGRVEGPALHDDADGRRVPKYRDIGHAGRTQARDAVRSQTGQPVGGHEQQ